MAQQAASFITTLTPHPAHSVMKDHEGIDSIWASSLRGSWAFFGGSGPRGKSIMDSARIPIFLGVGISRRICYLVLHVYWHLGSLVSAHEGSGWGIAFSGDEPVWTQPGVCS